MVELEKPLKKKDQILIDEEIAQRLQEELQAELKEEERLARQKPKMFVELMDKRKKNFTRLRAEEQRRKPLTKAQKRSMDTELVKESSKKAEMLDDSVEVEVDDEAEMKKHMEIVFDDEVSIDAIPLATKPPIIIDWKIIKEGKMDTLSNYESSMEVQGRAAGIKVNAPGYNALKDYNY
ncbi:hypothetical protein Tco_1043457 [Tanacetum coccineum]|uniref:Uncharacterized protein n=1 Tax=Tanacetum coccineum TaxID=301880 RepID=A0ABQ5GPA4_9ASTR